MSEMPSKTSIPVAVPNKSKKFFTQDHLTTVPFMRPRPIFCREYVPGRDMKVKVDSFLRANPMPVPIFGHAKVHNRAFFVPFRAVMPDFNDFYTNSPYTYSNPIATHIQTHVPVIGNDVIVKLFVQSVGGSNPLLAVGSANSFDIRYIDPLSTPSIDAYYVFTDLGIDIITILESLGYKVNWRLDDTTLISALPLMCYSKVLCDWFYPSAYVGDAAYQYVQGIFNSAIYDHVFDETELSAFLNLCRFVCYNPDYFVNAWDTPVGPNSTSFERSLNIKDPTNNASQANRRPEVYNTPNYQNDVTVAPSNGTPFIGSDFTNSVAFNGRLTQYVIDALKTLTDYTKRHQLSGVRALDRYLSEMGINLSVEILKRSMYLGSQEFDMEFYDVFSHSDTLTGGNGSPLGAYAGKGNGFSGMKEFSYDNGQEFGMFIVVNSLIPVIGYYQGQHREQFHINCLDFYHGDFDHMAIQAISAREVYVPQSGAVAIAGSGQSLFQKIFGFVPKYIEYNTPQDLQTGLYRIKTRQGLLPFYSLMRDLSYLENGTLAQVVHNVGFVEGADANQYNRIFYSNKEFMQFNAIHHFEITYVDSTLPAYDTYKFDEEENKHVTLDVNGSKLN